MAAENDEGTLLTPEYFTREDPSDDARFYAQPRMVVHTDDNFIKVLGELYGQRLPPDATILDVMSSYKSHLPPTYRRGRMVGLGMNAAEMKANTQLDDFVVHNLNQNPELPYGDEMFDAVLCAVSVQYLQKPVAVFKEVRRVLKPGGQFIVSFSNRMFPTKAVRVWRELTDDGHVTLVSNYFEWAGFAQVEVVRQVEEQGRNWLAYLNPKDPVFVVIGHKS